MEVILSVSGIRKHFSLEAVLVDVSFQLRAGDKVGLVGPNGCGKTTLLNILAEREEAEKGAIEKASGTTIGYLEQRPTISVDRNVIEEAKDALSHLIELQHDAERIAVEMAETKEEAELAKLSSRYDRIHELLQRHEAYHIDHRVARILHGVGFSDNEFEKPVKALSGGELNRLNLAKLLLEEPDIMLLDEPSNHLDLPATEWLEEFLQNTAAAVILVSHDRYFLDRVTNRTFELFRGTIDDYPGNFSKYVSLKEERLNVQTRTYEKYIEEVDKAKEFIRRNHYGMKAPQAEDRRKKLERLMETPAELPRRIEVPAMNFPKPSRSGDTVFRLDNVSKGFEVEGNKIKPLFRDLSLIIQRNERWGILGPNGCGKTTLLKCLLNLITPDTGKVSHGAGLKIGYFDQQLHVINDDMQVVDAIRPQKKIFEELERRKLLGAFGLTGDQQLQKVSSLSGGQRCRAALAKLSAEDANVLILDEPTNHLDIWARNGLEKAIKEFDGTVLFISHDRYFVDKVADHILIIQPNARFKTIEGNYSTFKQMVSSNLLTDPFNQNTSQNEITQQKEHINVAAKLKPTNSNQKLTEKQLEQLAWKENAKKKEAEKKNQQHQNQKIKPKRTRKFPFRKVADIEEEIFARETHILTLNQDLLQPQIARNNELAKSIHNELLEEQNKIKTLYEHWEESNELNW
ncbi:MAG: ABC-F family ATP-binding cassette domain-containing protein [Planctomycetaceae bacterium]|jgi:ATP-binding cassette subfamily F protein 3|nr:ABC-F family ATP-binding cassette domain-containing protein [Planctomycetaceae bacterium]